MTTLLPFIVNNESKDIRIKQNKVGIFFIMFHFVSPPRFALRPRTVSTTSQISQSSAGGGEEEEDKVVYLGDNKPVQVNRNKNNSISKDTKG